LGGQELYNTMQVMRAVRTMAWGIVDAWICAPAREDIVPIE
jgi:hypothetical protein